MGKQTNMNKPTVESEAQVAKILAERYSEKELMKAQDIIGDFADEMKEVGYTVEQCNYLFELLSDAINSID